MSLLSNPKFKLGVFYSIVLFIVFVYLQKNTFDKKLDYNGDNVCYYLLGKSIAEGNGYRDMYIHTQPQANHFPVGYPVIVAGIIKFVSDDISTVSKTNVVFFFATLILLFYVFYKWSDNIHLSFVAVILLEFNAHLLKFSFISMSEMPFLFFTSLGLFFIVKMDLSKFPLKDKYFYGLIFILFASYHIRTVGITFLGGVILYFLLSKKWWHAAFSLIGFIITAIPWYLRGKAVDPEGGAYLKALMFKNPYRKELGTMELGDWITRIWTNLERYLSKEIPSGMFGDMNIDYSTPEGGNMFLGTVILALTIFGIYKLQKHRNLVFGYMAGTAAILLLWPDAWFGIRFLLPVIPLIAFLSLFAILELLNMILEKVNIQIPNASTVLAFTMLIFVLPINTYTKNLKESQKQKVIPSYQNYFELAKWAKNNTPKDAVFCSRKPEFFHLYSDRIQTGFISSLVQEEVIQGLIDRKVDYVVLDQLGFSSTFRYLYPAIQKYPEKFITVQVMRNPDTYLLKFEPELGYWGEWNGTNRDGKGTYKWNNGMFYSGDWKANVRHGKGKMTFADGSSYEGDWLNDKMDGQGIFKDKNGTLVQQGTWANNQFTGK